MDDELRDRLDGITKALESLERSVTDLRARTSAQMESARRLNQIEEHLCRLESFAVVARFASEREEGFVGCQEAAGHICAFYPSRSEDSARKSVTSNLLEIRSRLDGIELDVSWFRRWRDFDPISLPEQLRSLQCSVSETVSRLSKDATLNEIEFEVWIAYWDTHALFEWLELDWKGRHREEIEERERDKKKADEAEEKRPLERADCPLPD